MTMNVVDIMTAHPITIGVHQTLQNALEVMDQNRIKHLPVVSSDNHIIGIVSDRDCRYALNSPFISREHWRAEGNRIKNLSLRTIMTPAPIIVEPHVPASEAARLMLLHRIGCLPVMRAETLIGIVTRSDVLVAFMSIHQRYEALAHQTTPVQKP